MVTRVPIYLGGTGESTQAAAQAALGLHTSNSVAFTTVTIGAVNVLANDYATLLSAYSNDVTTLATARGNDHATLISATTNPVITGNVLINSNSANDALRINQIGSGNAFVVEDSANPDATPFVVDSNGSVGIGTSSPNVLLHLSGSSTTARARIASTSAGASAFDGSGAGLELLAGNMNTTSKYTPAIKFGSTDVDFTTTNPKFGAALVATAAQTYSSDTTGGMNLEFWTAPVSPGTGSGLVQNMTLTSTGRLGIGTTSPDYPLSVQSTGDAQISLKNSSGNTEAYISTAGAFGSAGTDDLRIRSDAANIVFGFSGTETVRFTSSGNIGIGTSTPTATLDVVGTFSDAKANTVQQTLTDAATIAWDASLGRVATVTLGASRTFGAPTNLKVGTYILHVIQGGTGSYTITWNGVFKWTAATAPTLSTAVGRRDIFSFISDGTNLYGAMIPDVR